MKKITTLLVLLLIITGAASAQQSANYQLVSPKIHGYPVYGSQSLPMHSHPRLRNQDFTIDIDYDVADASNYNTGEYLSFIWASNMYYSLAAHDPIDSFSMNYCIVAYDTLVDETSLMSYPRGQVVNLTVDTILAVVGQVNHSHNPDTIAVSIVGIPDANNVLWTTNIIVPDTGGLSISSTGFHSWSYSYALIVPANFTLPAGRSNYGVMLQYYGDKRDTFGFLAGYADPGLAGCGQSTTKATKSTFYPNSYAYWVSQKALIPSSQGDIYYDCNQDGKYEAGTDGDNYIQNIKMLSLVTFTSDLGINDLKGNASLLNVYPNPSKDQSNIVYSIKSSTNVTISIYDVTGKLVQTISKGTVNPGKYTQAVDLNKMASGIYSFDINTTEGRSFGKIAVTK